MLLSHTYSFTVVQADFVLFVFLFLSKYYLLLSITEVLDLYQPDQNSLVYYAGRTWMTLSLSAACSTVSDRVPALPWKAEKLREKH